MAGEFETESLSLFTDSTGQVKIIPVSSPPGAGAGTPSPIGSMALSVQGFVYQKVGPLDTDWTSGGTLGETNSFSAFNNTPRGSNSTNYFTFLTLSADIAVAGNYILQYSYVWSSNSTSDNFLIRILNQLNVTVVSNIMAANDSTGNGINVERVDAGGTLNTGTDQRLPITGFIVLNLPIGLSTFTLQMAGSAINKRNTIYNVFMTLEKV